jgi:hypothetical protein
LFPLGISTVTCVATDASNNTASCSFLVAMGAAFGAPTLSPWMLGALGVALAAIGAMVLKLR